jgi:uncharacterized protein (TIGR02246 family)
METPHAQRGDDITDAAGALYLALLERWNARDAVGFAACFAPDGAVVGFDGSTMQGPTEIETALRQIFAHHATGAYVGAVREARPVGGGAVLVRAVSGVVPAGGADLNPALNAIQSLVAVPIAGRLRVAHYQNTPAQFHGRPDLREDLTRELRAVLTASGGATAATDGGADEPARPTAAPPKEHVLTQPADDGLNDGPVRPRFAGGSDIAIKVPRYRFEAMVAFYRDVVGLPSLGREGDSESFRFGSIRLWLDRVDHQSQTDVWLSLFTDDPDGAFAWLQAQGVPAREEVEPLGDFPGHWVSDPAGVILIVRGPDETSGEGRA